MNSSDLCDQVLLKLRCIARSIDLQSRELVRRFGLTGPQIFLLREITRLGDTTVSDLARQANSSQATITDILNRLEKKGLIRRQRSEVDKRRVYISATNFALETIDISMPLLQKKFIKEFGSISEWEQLQLLSALSRIADMMNTEDNEMNGISPDQSDQDNTKGIYMENYVSDHG